ncbi:MAG TPA: AMP-binding protein [Miltoncostaea sp.]|nr:AMP-binding protein [Miltoncostaea sp.]
MRVPLSLADFLDRAALHGDAVAVVDEPGGPAALGELTYAGLRRRAVGMARELARMGIGHGERVAIVSPNSARFVVALLGVSASGRVLVPVNFRLNADEVGYVVAHSGARVLLVDPELDEALRGVRAQHRIVLDGEADAGLFAEDDGDMPPWAPDEDATATINYTSGTTARPKGARLTHRTLVLHAMSIGWHLGVAPRDVYLHTLPLFHANGWGLPYACAAMGTLQVILRRVDGAEALRRVERHGVTLMCGAPAVADAIVGAAEAAGLGPGEAPGAGRARIFVGGASPPSSTVRAVEERLGWELMHGYGLTEAAPLLTINRRRAGEEALDRDVRARRIARQGIAAVGVRVRLADDGELLARSNHVFDGYWEQPEESATALADGWLHTGDGARLDDEGFVTITDRRKDVIVTGGENVSSIEVEDHLRAHPDVADCAVIGVPDERWGETVLAIVTLRQGGAADEAALIAHCRERMAHFKAPRRIEIRDALPRTATGKVQKFLLRAPYWEGVTPAGPAGRAG